MNVESIPKSTRPAAKLWTTIHVAAKKLLLSNVWCAHCRHEVTITDFAGTVVGGIHYLRRRETAKAPEGRRHQPPKICASRAEVKKWLTRVMSGVVLNLAFIPLSMAFRI